MLTITWLSLGATHRICDDIRSRDAEAVAVLGGAAWLERARLETRVFTA